MIVNPEFGHDTARFDHPLSVLVIEASLETHDIISRIILTLLSKVYLAVFLPANNYRIFEIQEISE